MTKISLRNIILLSLFVFFIFFMFFVYEKGQWRELIRFWRIFFDPKRLHSFLESFGNYAIFIFVILQIVQVLLSPIPGEITGVVGGFFFGCINGIAFSMIGLTLGSIIAFLVARTFGMRLIDAIIKKEYIEKFNNFITHKGLHISFILFLIPGFPKDSLCWLLGITRIRFLDFLFMNILGRFPGTLILTLQGNAVRNGKYKEFFFLLLGSICLTGILYLLRNHIIKGFAYVAHILLRKSKHERKCLTEKITKIHNDNTPVFKNPSDL